MTDSQRAFELLQAGEEDGIRRLLQDDPSTANARDACGVSLLMQALYHQRNSLAREIAKKKEKLDIFEASALGLTDRLKVLAADAAMVDAFSADGFTALHFACYFGQPEAAKTLLDRGARPDAVANNPTRVMPLHSAASARNLEAARALLEHGAPVNARQQSGYAPIHAAALNGDRAMIELFLAHGADPKIANEKGVSPSMAAREKGHEEIAVLLER